MCKEKRRKKIIDSNNFVLSFVNANIFVTLPHYLPNLARQ